jgi:hypothetical protein
MELVFELYYYLVYILFIKSLVIAESQTAS